MDETAEGAGVEGGFEEAEAAEGALGYVYYQYPLYIVC